MTDEELDRAQEVAGQLSPFLRQLILGDYDPEFASTEDASKLIALGLWSWDAAKQDPESEYYELDVTDLGHAVRQILLDQQEQAQ